MKPSFYIIILSMVLGLPGCRTHESSVAALASPPKMIHIPAGTRVVAHFHLGNEFIVDMMPLSDGQAFHPCFSVFNEKRDNFSSERSEALIRYYRKTKSKSQKRILLKSNHYLVLWNAADRRIARGTVLQERHFSPDWKSYREEERLLIDRLIQIAAKERIEVWINEGMNLTNGTWRLMTPPFQFDLRGDSKLIRKKAVEIEHELNTMFRLALKSGKIPGVDPQAHGIVDVFLPGGWQNLETYPQKAQIRVQIEGSEDLLEYHYEQTSFNKPWALKEAWRVAGSGVRTRLSAWR